MIRYAAALMLLALAACAGPQVSAQQQAINARADQAALFYQQMRLTAFEQEMLHSDKELTYGYAVVNCGLRRPDWMAMLQEVYKVKFRTVYRLYPLTPDQITEATRFAEAHVSNPSPPPYLCGRLATDAALPELDYEVAMMSLILASEKQNPG